MYNTCLFSCCCSITHLYCQYIRPSSCQELLPRQKGPVPGHLRSNGIHHMRVPALTALLTTQRHLTWPCAVLGEELTMKNGDFKNCDGSKPRLYHFWGLTYINKRYFHAHQDTNVSLCIYACLVPGLFHGTLRVKVPETISLKGNI